MSNRILERRADKAGLIYADTEQRAQEIGDTQKHTHGMMLIGQARYTLNLKSVLAEISTDIEAIAMKLKHDAPDIELNKPIIFKTKYRFKNHVADGADVFGVLLTGYNPLIIV